MGCRLIFQAKCGFWQADNTPGKPRRIELDFVRGIAILAVMLFHFTDTDTPPPGFGKLVFFVLHFGRQGVDLFFVLSGFLVGGLLLQEWKTSDRVDAKRFLLRRIFKLWPLYYVLLIFHAVLRRHPLHDFFWQNFFHIQNYAGTSLLQTRTLAIEEHFYLLLTAGVAIIAARKGGYRSVLIFCMAACALSIVVRCINILFCADYFDPYWTHNRLDAPFLGVALAALFHFHPQGYRTLVRRRWPLLLCCLCGFGWLLWKPWDSNAMATVGLTIIALACCAFMLLMLEHSGRMRQWLPYRILAWLGVYAYGIFLWHSIVREPLQNAFRRLPFTWAWLLVVPCQVVLASLIGFATTRLVEWPFLRWRERIPYLADRTRLLPPDELAEEPASP